MNDDRYYKISATFRNEMVGTHYMGLRDLELILEVMKRTT